MGMLALPSSSYLSGDARNMMSVLPLSTIARTLPSAMMGEAISVRAFCSHTIFPLSRFTQKAWFLPTA